VAKGRIWYVVAQVNGEMRTYRASRIRSASLLDTAVTRPADFDLAAYWDATQAQFTASLPRYPVVARLRADLLDWARAMWRYTRIDSISQPDESGWLTLQVTFESAREACFCLLGLGGVAEALQPAELRELICERGAAASLRHAANGAVACEPAVTPMESAAER
jgi:predicted DNA-binding transcriptional regulator YafY